LTETKVENIVVPLKLFAAKILTLCSSQAPLSSKLHFIVFWFLFLLWFLLPFHHKVCCGSSDSSENDHREWVVYPSPERILSGLFLVLLLLIFSGTVLICYFIFVPLLEFFVAFAKTIT